MITLNLPYPPSMNHMYKRNRIGGVYLADKARNYRNSARYLALEQLGHYKAMEGHLQIIIDLYPPDARKRDIDNILKVLLDSIMYAGVVQDDSQFRDLHVMFHPKDGKGYALVRIAQQVAHA